MGLSLIGRVAKPHGVRGCFGVIPEHANAERYLPLTRIYLGTYATDAVAYAIKASRLHTTRRGTVLLIRARGVASPEEANGLHGMLAFADDNDVPTVAHHKEDPDLTGFIVETVNGRKIGILKEVMPAPASDVYVVDRSERDDAMIPAVPAFIECVDLDRERILVRPIEGMLD